LAEIAPGNFRGHYFVARQQKASFLPAAPMQGACGASSGNFRGHYGVSAFPKRREAPWHCIAGKSHAFCQRPT
jgi:hypothetical protein